MTKILLALLILGVGIGSLSNTVARAQTNGQAPPPVPVEAREVLVEPLNENVSVIGSIRSNESVVLKPEIAGIVVKIGFHEGSIVNQGALLVALDDSVNQAEVHRAEAELKIAERTYERASELLERQAGTERVRDEALARLESAMATLELEQVKLEKTRILAPFSGALGLRQVSVGTYVTPGQPLVNLEDIETVKVDFNVAERYLNALKPGQDIEVRVDPFPDRVFAGEIYAIDPQIDVNGRSISVRARVPNTERLLRPGLFARVTVAINVRETAIRIPEEAIIPRGDERHVFRIIDGKAVMTKVEIGTRRDGLVEIVDGLSAGDIVVTAGHQKIRDGAPVNPVDIPAASNAVTSG